MQKLLYFLFLIISVNIYGNYIGFEQNIGQIKDQNQNVNSAISFTLKLDGFNVNLNQSGFNYDFYETEKDYIKTHRVEFKFKNYNRNYKVIKSDQLNYRENIIKGNDELTIDFYKKIVYQDFYPNIDLEFYVTDIGNKPFEYNFILHPSADINMIEFEIKGAQANLSSNQLKFNLRFGELIESLPKSWIQNTIDTEEVKIEYCYHNDGSIGLQSHQDIINKKVIIDPLPIRKWGSYLSKYTFSGYPTNNHFMTIHKVKFFKDEFYIYGTTNQKNLATIGAFQTTIIDNYEPFLAKFNTNGERLWLTYYGSGVNTEYAGAFDLDSDGNVYLAYTAYGNGMATEGAFQTHRNGYSDFLISKFNPNGQRIWSTYYGGNLNDNVNDLIVDKINGFIYIAGNSGSNDLTHPSYVQNPINTNREGLGLILKIDLNGNYLSSTFTPAHIKSITVDNDRNLIFSGRKSNHLIELTVPFINSTGNTILSKYSQNLNLIWSKNFLGNGYMNEVSSIIIDLNNNIFVTGTTTSTEDIAFGNAYSSTYSFSNNYISYAGFLKKLDTNGIEIFGTYIGAKDYTYITDAALGDNNEIIVSGNATRTDNIIFGYNPHQNISTAQINGNGNALLMKFNNSGNPIWGFLAGDSGYSNRYHSIDYNKNTKDIIAVGWNISPNMISTPNGFQTNYISQADNGTLTLYSDVENNFKIERTGDECYINSLVYTASGAINYTWYDYDNHIISTQANFIPTAIGQYTCKFDDGVNIGYISIIVKEANLTIPPTPSINYLPRIQEYCSVTLTPPTALSGCGEEIIGTTPQTYFDSPGEYLITWTFTDRFENTSTQEQQVEVLATDHFIPDNLVLSLCENETGTIFNLQLIESEIPEATYKYYANLSDLENDLEIDTPQNYIYNTAQPYFYIKGILESGCINYKRVDLTIYDRPVINQLQKTLCDAQNIGYVSYDLSLLRSEISSDQVKFYSDSNYINEITVPLEIQNNQIIYTKATNTRGCSSHSFISFTLANYTILQSSPIAICKDINTIGEFNLLDKANELARIYQVNASEIIFFETLQNALQNQNKIHINYLNTNQINEIYATIISSDACKTFYKIPLVESINPIINVSEEYYKCKEESITITLDRNYNQIIWSNGSTESSTTFTTPGIYTVTVKDGNCSVTKTVEIKDYPDLIIDYAYDGTHVTFQFLNDLNAMVSLDQINWSQNSFNLAPKEYTFYFKSVNNCIETRNIYLYKDIPTFISPNGDGKNDYWDISYIKDLKSVKIYDRFGKVIYEKDKSQQPIIWDGKYMNKVLPSTSYWYTIEFENGKNKSGYITLKNK